MGSTHHLFPLSSPPINKFLTINPPKTSQNPNFYPQFQSNRRTTSGAFPGGRFDFDDDFRREKRRNWWSDDEDDDDDDDDDEFVFWEEPDSIDWIFKVLSIFGWMVPAIVISTLLGTGTNSLIGSNSLIMALILPLGQTALSLVIDRLGGNPSPVSNSSPRSKSSRRPKRKKSNSYNPYVGNSYSYQKNTEPRNTRNRISPKRGGYNSSVNKSGESGSRFGGWDELDEQVGTTASYSGETEAQELDGVKRHSVWSGKPSKIRTREKPLLMRLMIAVFPLLGSWSRFFF